MARRSEGHKDRSQTVLRKKEKAGRAENPQIPAYIFRVAKRGGATRQMAEDLVEG
jgi:hypothetical protein